MLINDEDDPPEFQRKVNTRVTIDMIDTEELVQELVDRQRLFILTARRTVNAELYKRPGFYQAIWPLLARDLAERLTGHYMLEHAETNAKGMEFSSTIVVLHTVPEERPI